MASLDTARICPYCSERIELGDCPIVATNIDPALVGIAEVDIEQIELPSGRRPLRKLEKTGWPVVGDAPRAKKSPAPGNRSDRSVLGRAFAGGSVAGGRRGGELPPLDGGEFPREDSPARACPRCEFPLPLSIDHREAFVIAVVGVNRVGKTHLLATSLTEAYRRDGLQVIGCTDFTPDDNCGRRFQENYYTPLFRDHQILEPTQLGGGRERFEPLLFNATFSDCDPFSLALHDVAGEVLGDRRQRVRAATYLYGARGIIFVVDPRDLEGLRDGLPAEPLGEHEAGWDQGTLLSTCLGSDGLLANSPPVPVAIAIAKADLLPIATGEELPFLERAPRSETREEFYDHIRSTSEEVEAFLERYEAHNILRPAREYQRRLHADGDRVALTFHAFSALGRPPHEIAVGGAKVEPINSLDPLAAILAHV